VVGVTDVVLITFDIGVQVADVDEKRSAALVLNERNDLGLDEASQLPFTHRQIGGGLLGAQEPSGHHGNNSHSGVPSHAGSSAPTCQPRPTSRASGDHGAIPDFGQISGVGPLPSGQGSTQAYSARAGGGRHFTCIWAVFESTS
jgi:hypothetical protein